MRSACRSTDLIKTQGNNYSAQDKALGTPSEKLICVLIFMAITSIRNGDRQGKRALIWRKEKHYPHHLPPLLAFGN